MKKGPLLTAIFTILSVFAVVTAFVENASPYVTIADAKKSSDTQLHIAGEIVKGTIRNNFKKHEVSFQLKDKDGDKVLVRHTGEIPTELDQIEKVVAIGGMQNGEFRTTKLLVKCPSKYEADKPKAVASNETR